MLPRLRLNAGEQQRVSDILQGYLCDSSSIVKTCAMEALADFTRQAPDLQLALLRQLQQLTVSGTPAMRARGRRLLGELKGSGQAT
jgi:vesicle coat complex subunit